MKPHLLMLLLLAVPPLICNILACENAEKTDAPASEKSFATTKEITAPVSRPTNTPAVLPAKRTSTPATPSRMKAWSMM
jgi:hypothetical protein